MVALITEKESLIWASGHYLGEHLPEDYDGWEEEERDVYLVENAWEPFEYNEAAFIWECIVGLADDFKSTVNNKLTGSKTKVVRPTVTRKGNR